ncbi:MAG: DUF2868 domain-containing protein [Burkholderiales bacterium]
MNEGAARQVLLVRALEGAESPGRVLTEDDQGHAARAAAELVRWQAAEKGEPASAEAFVAKRAELLAARFAERSPKAHHAVGALRWRAWIGVALPLAALALGAAAEHVADRGRVSILAFPLLGIVAWNLAVYAWLVVRRFSRLATGEGGGSGWTRRLVAGVRADLGRRSTGPLAGALGNFALDWTRRSAPLVAARAARVLHLCAVLLAAGAMAGMYLRGLAFEYRAGWESTFLDAQAVHAILSLYLQPAAWLLGQPLPAVERIAALQWAGGGTGENAARWIHLHATTVLLAVVVPRLALAAIAWHRERSFATRFPLDLGEPYFRRVLADWRESPAHVRVQAYAYTLSEPAAEGLHELAAHLFGRDVRVHAAPPVAYGEEDEPAAFPEAPAPDLVIALFNLGSTPETENHGVFLDGLARRAKRNLVVLVDESPYRRRLGEQAGSRARLAERRQSWSGFAESRGLRAVFADLEAPDLAAAERELDMQRASADALG